MSIVSEVEGQLAELRRMEAADGTPDLRTSVLTHIVWAPPKWAEAAMKTLNALPVGWVETVDIANAVLFLASDESRYVTGLKLAVDAGLLTRVG